MLKLIKSYIKIRLFGDPHVQNTEVPTQIIGLSVQVESIQQMSVQHEPSQDVSCDFVDGFVFGDTIGIGFRSATWAVVTRVASKHRVVIFISLSIFATHA
jgi:hypothetical protein